MHHELRFLKCEFVGSDKYLKEKKSRHSLYPIDYVEGESIEYNVYNLW